MGIAVIIPNVQFQDTNLGRVTLQQGVPLRSMTIVGPDEITEPTIFTVNFFPANTSQRGIAWSVVSGGTYASIDEDTGELTPIVGAVVNDVVIRATSTADNTIYAEKTVAVSYGMVYAQKYGLVSDGTARIATLYTVIRKSKIVCDFKINSLPSATTTTAYYTVWGSYTSESSPVTRHLFAWKSSPAATFVRQNVDFGKKTPSSDTGIAALNRNSYLSINSRYREEVSRDGFKISNGQDDWQVFDFDSFDSPLVPIRIFGLSGGNVLNMTLYAFQAYEDDVPVLDLVPCTLLQNIGAGLSWDGEAHSAGENGLWDKVGRMFYGNAASSGSFTVLDD